MTTESAPNWHFIREKEAGFSAFESLVQDPRTLALLTLISTYAEGCYEFTTMNNIEGSMDDQGILGQRIDRNKEMVTWEPFNTVAEVFQEKGLLIFATRDLEMILDRIRALTQ